MMIGWLHTDTFYSWRKVVFMEKEIIVMKTKSEFISQAPGRVEILGNHTDYNGGCVLTAAINKVITIRGQARLDDKVILYSEAYGQETCFSLSELVHDPDCPWASYIKGVILELCKNGVPMRGFQARIGGNLTIGAGVSSSAALEVATALFLQGLYPYSLLPMELAQLCRRAENFFVGVPCGLLDQFSSVFGEKDSMLFLDCLTLEYKVLPVPPVAVVICDTGIKHQLVQGEYKVRRKQCREAAQILSHELGHPIQFLRDVSMAEWGAKEHVLPAVLRRRARHVITENMRVYEGMRCLQKGDLQGLGKLMQASHTSSRNDFENSCEELDILVREAGQISGCYGSKLSGGGLWWLYG